MKKILISAALVALTATTAFSSGLDIGWNNCLGAGGASNINLVGCTGSASPLNKSYGSMILTSPINNVVSTDLFIDLQLTDPGLPTFWQFKTSITPTLCNDGLSISAVHEPDFAGTICTNATNMWGDVFAGDVANGTHLAGFALGYVPNISGAANRGRIVGSLFRLSSNPINLAAANYFVVMMQINAIRSNTRTVPGPCVGCTTPAAIVWNQCNVGTVASAGSASPEAITPITGPGNVTSCMTAGGPPSTLCDATPTQNKTWGALKSLYR